MSRKAMRESRGKRSLALLSGMLMSPLALAIQGQASDEPKAQKQSLEEVTVVGTQIKGAQINDALAVSVVDAEDIATMGVDSGDELLALPLIGGPMEILGFLDRRNAPRDVEVGPAHKGLIVDRGIRLELVLLQIRSDEAVDLLGGSRHIELRVGAFLSPKAWLKSHYQGQGKHSFLHIERSK